MVCSAQPRGSLRREATPPGDKAPSEPKVSKGSDAMKEGEDEAEDPASEARHRLQVHAGAHGKGLDQTPTCNPDEAAEISIGDDVGVRAARNFQSPASVI